MLRKHIGARALLIQDAYDIAFMIRRLTGRLPAHAKHYLEHLSIDSLIEWVIREELECTYLIEIEGHYRTDPHRTIYAELRNLTHQCLGPLITSRITVPKLRISESTFIVTFMDNDVYIWYYD